MRASLGLLSTPEVGGGGGSITVSKIHDSRPVSHGGAQGSGDFTSASWTVVSGSSLLVACFHVDNQAPSSSTLTESDIPTPTTSGLTWTKVGSAYNTGRFWSAHAIIYKADASSSGSKTWQQAGSSSWDTEINAIDLVIYELSGALAASSQTKAVGNAVSTSGTGRDPGAQSVTLPVAPASNSVVFGLASLDHASTGSVTPGSGWTEGHERAANGAGPFLNSESQYRTGTTSTTVPWADLSNDTQVFDYALLAWEVLAA